MIFDDRGGIMRYWSCDWHWSQRRQFLVIWLWLDCFRLCYESSGSIFCSSCRWIS